MTAEISTNGARPLQPPFATDLPAQAVQPLRAEPKKLVAPEAEQPQRTGVGAEDLQRNVKEAVERLNEQMRKAGRNLNFSLDDRIDRMVITVKNSETGEVIRQIPDEAVVKAAHQIEQLKGLLHNEVT